MNHRTKKKKSNSHIIMDSCVSTNSVFDSDPCSRAPSEKHSFGKGFSFKWSLLIFILRESSDSSSNSIYNERSK